MNLKLFGSSGIRGRVNKEITPVLTQRIGAALATIHQGGTTVVGRDARISGPMLEGALVSGLASAGMDSFIIGLVPTPLSAWTVKYLGADAGIEITASHNPADYNGLKIFNNKGMSLTQKEQLEVENVLENELYRLAPWDGVGTLEKIFPIEDYINELSLSIDNNASEIHGSTFLDIKRPKIPAFFPYSLEPNSTKSSATFLSNVSLIFWLLILLDNSSSCILAI